MRKKRELIAWALVLPALLIRGSTIIVPICTTAWYSVLDYNLIRRTKKFIGFKNIIKLFNDISIKSSVKFTITFTMASMFFIIVLGILVSLLLNVNFKGRKFLRSTVLIPWALPTIVIGIAAQWAFNDTYGFINDLISRVTFSKFNFPWLVDTVGAQVAVIIVDVWKNVPFFAIMVLAGLQSIPIELYDSAKIDGAGVIKAFFNITIPHIKHILITMGLFFTLWRLTSFDLVYAMTQGGPGTITSLISYQITKEAFDNLNYGYASAISMLLFLIMIVVSVFGIKMQNKIDY
jgi:multiple sugar transport system permease protein